MNTKMTPLFKKYTQWVDMHREFLEATNGAYKIFYDYLNDRVIIHQFYQPVRYIEDTDITQIRDAFYDETIHLGKVVEDQK